MTIITIGQRFNLLPSFLTPFINIPSSSVHLLVCWFPNWFLFSFVSFFSLDQISFFFSDFYSSYVFIRLFLSLFFFDTNQPSNPRWKRYVFWQKKNRTYEPKVSVPSMRCGAGDNETALNVFYSVLLLLFLFLYFLFFTISWFFVLFRSKCFMLPKIIMDNVVNKMDYSYIRVNEIVAK